ncbi:Transcriptional regulator, LysR family [uncultured Alphaproteobacteria bacterium]|uniref:Transcriptional regulator, LysR family n=1 Tax=uncultured Alphaproteobacteria bacterium TaxID=91750 RepID=A0A212K6V9_9PROT|nr:Transcriptional regulator, LysR family [uncultured Alphaproteobacteria bacterium]
MELRHLRYFLAVAEEKNFTRAAARIGIGQPPLSHQIQDLERELGVMLFHRVPHGAELTEAGQAFLPRAQSALVQADQARVAAQRASRGETGHIRIGFTGAGAFNPAVPAVIRGFRRAYPEVVVDLEERNTGHLVEGLRDNGLDGAFIRPGPEDLSDLRLMDFTNEPMMIALPESHPRAGEARLPLTALAREPLILFPREISIGLYDEVLSCCRAAGFEPVLGQQAPQFASAVNLVAAEIGVSVVPRSFARIRVEGVAYIEIADIAPAARLAFAHHRGSRSVTLRNFSALVLGAILNPAPTKNGRRIPSGRS